MASEYILNTTLPTPRRFTASVYDGNDTIYIIGGEEYREYTATKEIVKFTVSTHSLEIVSNFPHESDGTPSAVFVNGSIYYVDGPPLDQNMYRVDLGNLNHYHLTNLSSVPWFKKIVWDGDDGIYIFSYDILKYTISNNSIQSIVGVPTLFGFNNMITTAGNNTAYIVQYNSFRPHEILKYNFGDSSAQIVTEIPSSSGHLSAGIVWIGDKLTMIFQRLISQYDPVTNEVWELSIPEFPLYTAASPSSAVYVPKNNAVYIFGGEGCSQTWTCDIIRYLPLNESSTAPPSTVASTSTIKLPETTEPPKEDPCDNYYEGKPCLENDCSQCGFCVNRISYFYRCDRPNEDESGVIVREQCHGKLWWNPHGRSLPVSIDSLDGSCDFWENLSEDTKQQYKEDAACFPPLYCNWGQDENCSPRYWFEDPEKEIKRENITCPSYNDEQLLWDPISESCQECKYVLDSEGIPCLCE